MKTDTIIRTNCINGMKQLPDECIPLTVTSPPYGKMRKNVIPYRWEDFVQIAQQLSRITMVGGVICWVLRNQIVNQRENCQAEREKLYFVDELGLWSSHTIIGAPMGEPFSLHRRYASNFDFIYVFSKLRPQHIHVIADKRNKCAGELKRQRTIRNPDGTERIACGGDHIVADVGSRTNVWRYPIGGKNTATDGHISSVHDARMPESVAEDLIISFSKPNDLVFDPFAGAGTTLKMAMLNNRKFLGMEVSAEYVKIIRRRLEHAEKKDRPKRRDAFLNRFHRPESAA